MKLTAEQFARLTALLAKGDNLTAEEAQEKAALEAIIVEPAATGDSGTGEETGTEEEADPAPAPTGDDVVEDQQAFAALPAGAKFRAILNSRASLVAKLGAATAQIAALTGRATAAEADLAAARASLTEAQTALATSQARVTQLEAEAKDLNQAVVDELAGIGHQAKDLPGVQTGPGNGTPATEAELEERLAQCKTHAERVALIQAFKAAQAKAKNKAAA